MSEPNANLQVTAAVCLDPQLTFDTLTPPGRSSISGFIWKVTTSGDDGEGGPAVSFDFGEWVSVDLDGNPSWPHSFQPQM